MLDRNRRIKAHPERFQETEEEFDLVVTVEERVYDQVIECKYLCYLLQYCLLCSSRKYPYPPPPPTEEIFSKTLAPLNKFQLSFIQFFKFFGLTDPHPTPSSRNLKSFCGVYGYFLDLHINQTKLPTVNWKYEELRKKWNPC